MKKLPNSFHQDGVQHLKKWSTFVGHFNNISMQFPLQGIQWRLDLVTPQRAVRAELPEGVPVSWRPENPRDFLDQGSQCPPMRVAIIYLYAKICMLDFFARLGIGSFHVTWTRNDVIELYHPRP